MWLASTRTNPNRATTPWAAEITMSRRRLTQWGSAGFVHGLADHHFLLPTPKGGLRYILSFPISLFPPPSFHSPFPSQLPFFDKVLLCALDCSRFYLNRCKVEQVLRSLCQINLEPVFSSLKTSLNYISLNTQSTLLANSSFTKQRNEPELNLINIQYNVYRNG